MILRRRNQLVALVIVAIHMYLLVITPTPQLHNPKNIRDIRIINTVTKRIHNCLYPISTSYSQNEC